MVSVSAWPLIRALNRAPRKLKNSAPARTGRVIFQGCVAVSRPATIAHGTAARSTDELDPAPGDQAAAFPAGSHVGLRALVRGVPAEPAQPGRDDGRARRAGRP